MKDYLFEIGDTLVLSSKQVPYPLQTIVIDRILPGSCTPEHLPVDTMVYWWELQIDRMLTYYQKGKVPARETIKEMCGFHFSKQKNHQYFLVEEKVDEKILPHGLYGKSNPVQWFYIDIPFRAEKVGSIFDWDVEEVLTHNHAEIRRLGRQMMER